MRKSELTCLRTLSAKQLQQSLEEAIEIKEKAEGQIRESSATLLRAEKEKQEEAFGQEIERLKNQRSTKQNQMSSQNNCKVCINQPPTMDIQGAARTRMKPVPDEASPILWRSTQRSSATKGKILIRGNGSKTIHQSGMAGTTTDKDQRTKRISNYTNSVRHQHQLSLEPPG